ncbi:MAG: APC family permease [Ktedonobacteraceae bacterium]
MATIEWRTRDTDQKNAPEVRGSESLQSEEYVVKTMPSILGKFDMVAIYLMIIFYATNAATAVGGGASAFTYLFIGAITFFIPCVIATAQLGVMFPHEGSLYNWTHKALGGYWSFFVAFCAWFPGVLVLISASDVIATYLNGLNANWLVQPWQQGLAIIVIIMVTGVISVQRFRMVKNTLNVAAILTLTAVFLIGVAGVAWLLKGNHSATDFSLPNWGINGNLSTGNIYLFGLVTLAYLGIESPLNMGGEISSSGVGEGRKRKIITGHLLWGTILVLIGYFVVAFSLLVVEGQTAGSATTFSLVQTVSKVLGSTFGFVTAVCLMSFFVFSATTYNLTYARLLLVAGIDQRLPVRIGRLNKNRVPAAAIIFQSMVAVGITALMFFVVPYITHLNTPATLSTQIYNVTLAASTLVWAISTAFLFINLMKFYQRDPRSFRLQRIFPMPVIWISVVLGVASCATAIVGTLFFSWIPSYISNGQWWYIIGGLTVVCLIVAAIGSMLASSEASWQNLKEADKG